MAVLQISTKEFKKRQASILDDNYFTPEMISKIDQSLQEAKEGKIHHFESVNALDKFIDAL